MQVWAALVARRDVLPARAEQWISENCSAWLPFGDCVVRRAQWISPSRRVHIHSWDNGQALVDNSIAPFGEEGALTGSGHFVHGGSLLDHAQIATMFAKPEERSTRVARLGGVFALCFVDRDVVRAWCSRGRLESVFFQSTPEYHVVSNRPLVAHSISRMRTDPVYSPAYAAQLLAAGLPAGTHTPFEGVFQLPERSELRVAADGIEVIDRTDDDRLIVDELPIAATQQALLDATAFLRGMGSGLRVSLTGGKDSRLIAALLHRAGVDFTTSTLGLAADPDVVVAKQVADLLGVSHRRVPPGSSTGDVVEVDVSARIHSVVRAAEGMTSAYNSAIVARPREAAPGVGLGGAGGEVLRGGLARELEVDRASLERRIRWQMLQNYQLLTDWARAIQEEEVERWLVSAAGLGGPEALAWYHRDIRLGRWNMARRLSQCGQLTVQPFLDSRAIGAAMEVPLAERVDERAFYGILEQTNPALARLPLATGAWRFRPDEASRSGRRPFVWMTQLSGQLGEALVETVHGSRQVDRLFEIVDPVAFEGFVERVRAGDHDGQEHSARFLWSMATLAVLWSDQWQSDAQAIARRVAVARPATPAEHPSEAEVQVRSYRRRLGRWVGGGVARSVSDRLSESLTSWRARGRSRQRD